MKVLDDYNKIRDMLIKHREEALLFVTEIKGDSGRSIKASDRVMEYILNIGESIKDIDRDIEKIDMDINRRA